MDALTNEQLDEMDDAQREQSLLRLLAYCKMSTLIEAIRETYIDEDREQIAAAIIGYDEDDDDDDEDTIDTDKDELDC